METKFYYCPTCGNVIIKMVDSGVTPSCCGEHMQELTPNSVDTYNDKHLPVVCKTEDHCVTVCIGSEPHPMTEEHHIKFILLETENGWQVQNLTHGDKKAEAKFCSLKDKPVAVYAYCNLHGLWCADIRSHGFFNFH